MDCFEWSKIFNEISYLKNSSSKKKREKKGKKILYSYPGHFTSPREALSDNPNRLTSGIKKMQVHHTSLYALHGIA